MRIPRQLTSRENDPEKPVVHHIAGRLIKQNPNFDALDREHFYELLRSNENYSGCRVLAFCIMPDHYHILLEVPQEKLESLSDAKFFDRLASIYPDWKVHHIKQQLKGARTQNNKAKVRLDSSR